MKTSTTTVHGQRGAVLIITMIMLVLLTLITVSAIRATTTDEKMAGNSRDRDKALQAAEAAVQQCLNMVNAGTFAPVLLPVPASSNAPQHWDVDANWSSSSPNSLAVSLPGAGLAESPRCLVESLGTGTGSFRVTGRAVGASIDSVVMLQATYSTQ